MTYTPRRLRPRQHPRWLITGPSNLTAEQAKQIKEQWMKVQRNNTAVVVSSNFKVTPLDGRVTYRSKR